MAVPNRSELAITLPLDSLADMTRGEEMPDKAKIIFSLMSIGMSQDKVARVLGNSPATIKDYVKKYDKDGCIVDTIIARKYFLAGTLESIATQVSSTITEDDLSKLSVIQKMSVIEKCLKIAQGVAPKMPERESGVDDALKVLENSK